MECKGIDVIVIGAFTVCFNRNIVECKADSVRRLLKEKRVLIETLWNVKYIQEINFCKPTRFNRNIVECKAGLRWLVYSIRKKF